VAATVLVIGLGDLGTRVLDSLARLPELERLVGASRDEEHGRARAGQASLVAELAGGPRRVEFERLDVADTAATAELLSRLDAEVVVMAASRLTWWRPPDDERLAALPFGIWLPLQLTLIRSLMVARRDAGSPARVLSLPYPDAVGPALAALGLAPDLGGGNVAETAPKLARLAGPGAQVRLVMHHAAQRYAFPNPSDVGVHLHHLDEPPWAAEVRVDGERLDEERVRELFSAPYPLPEGRETHELTAAATAHAVRALLAEEPVATHAPAPGGRPGGYPVRMSRAGVELDLPDGLDEVAAVALNERAARWDGIERIEADGTIVFTEAFLGFDRVRPDEVDAVADELEARR
jgi:KR domain-containing protein